MRVCPVCVSAHQIAEYLKYALAGYCMGTRLAFLMMKSTQSFGTRSAGCWAWQARAKIVMPRNFISQSARTWIAWTRSTLFLARCAFERSYLQKGSGRHPACCLADQSWWQVTEGLDVLTAINEAFVDAEGRPLQNVRIRHTIILDDPFPDPAQLADHIPDASPVPVFAEVSNAMWHIFAQPSGYFMPNAIVGRPVGG